MQAESRLYAVAKDHALVQRLLPYYRIIRRDLRGDPVVILPGQLYVTESALRASTGTHYTPRFLAEQVAEGALEPLVYNPGPLQTADRSQWKLLTAEEILALRIADIAMGSGAFLVAACRYLAGKLLEAWSLEGNVDALRALSASPVESGLDLDVAADPLVIKARRAIIEHCLYGVDINEMAVEMAKLSLWLVSMDPGRPFTFLDDKLAVGDSLLGITSIEQLEWMHLNPAEGRKLHEGVVLLDFMSGVRRVLADVSEQRRLLVDIPDDIDGIAKKREILTEVRSKTKDLSLYADLLAGAALVTRRWLGAAKLAHDAAVDGAVAEAERQGQAVASHRPARWRLRSAPAALATGVPRGLRPGEAGLRRDNRQPAVPGRKEAQLVPRALPTASTSLKKSPTVSEAMLTSSPTSLLRVHGLLNSGGQAGLIATNTLAQGDTREVGLDQIVASGVEIRQAIKSKPWPSKSAVLEYCWRLDQSLSARPERLTRIADGIVVEAITPSLDPASRVTGIARTGLLLMRGISFIGS